MQAILYALEILQDILNSQLLESVQRIRVNGFTRTVFKFYDCKWTYGNNKSGHLREPPTDQLRTITYTFV